MKKLGIIGGAGPLASALLYESIIKECYASASAVPEMILINYPFKRELTLLEAKEGEKILLAQLSYCIELLSQGGAELALLACNTLHLYLKLLPNKVPFLSLPDLVMEEAIKQGSRRLLLLGTEKSCHSPLYRHPAIEVVAPGGKEQQMIEEVIDRILGGKVEQNDSLLLSNLIEEMGIRPGSPSFDGIILGCTDLPVLHHYFPLKSHLPIYDSIKVPARFVSAFL